MLPAILGALAPVAEGLIDSLFETDAEKAEARAKVLRAQQDGRLKATEQQLSAIIMEAKSADPWTSRARPAFLYVVYTFLLAAIPFGVGFMVAPDRAAAAVEGVRLWLAAIPDAMWTLFGAGYLGYTGARSLDKRGLMPKGAAGKFGGQGR